MIVIEHANLRDFADEALERKAPVNLLSTRITSTQGGQVPTMTRKAQLTATFLAPDGAAIVVHRFTYTTPGIGYLFEHPASKWADENKGIVNSFTVLEEMVADKLRRFGLDVYTDRTHGVPKDIEPQPGELEFFEWDKTRGWIAAEQLPTVEEHLRYHMDEDRYGIRIMQDGRRAVIFFGPDEDGVPIPITDLNFNQELGYFRVSMFPEVAQECRPITE